MLSFLFLIAVPLTDVLPPMLAGLERTSSRTLLPAAYVQSQRRDPYHAKAYVSCGLKIALEAKYGDELVTVLELETPLAALCAFGNDKTLDGNPLDAFTGPQAEAYRSPGALFLRQGRFYAQIKGTRGTKALALLKALSFSLPNPQLLDPQIETLRQLPVSGRIPGSDRYLASGVFGWSELPRGYSADYGCGDIGVSIAHVALPSGVSAASVMKQVIAEAKGRSYNVFSATLGDDSVHVVPEGGGNVIYFVRIGEHLAVLDADAALPEVCGFLGEELKSIFQAPMQAHR